MLIWILRILHIFSGVLWAGYAIFAALILIPAVRDSGQAGGAVMEQLGRRKLSPYIASVAGINVLSGLWLFHLYFSQDWLHSPTGMVLGLGSLAALLAFAYGIAVTKPTADKAIALSASIKGGGGSPSGTQASEMAALLVKLEKAGTVNALLLTVAALCMAASRFVPQF